MTRTRAALLSIGLLQALAGCSAPEPVRPNVVLVVVDTLRADHLSLYGYPRATSPQLDAIAEESVVFDRAVTVMSHTLPATLSLMTGLHPETHGVFSNGRRYRSAAPTLAERLARAGYETAGFVSGSPLLARSGMNRGFEKYADTVRADRGLVAPRVSGEGTNERVMTWLDQDRDAPFFLFVHYFDTHRPYRSPPTGSGPFSVDDSLDRILRQRGLDGVRVADVSSKPILLDGRAVELREAINAYDNQVHRVDALIGELVSALRERGVFENTIFILTADHGEGLGQHRYYSHGLRLYEEQLRIPLILRAPGWAPRRSAARVSLLDIAPTVLDLLGLAGDPALQGHSLSNTPTERWLLASRRVFPAPIRKKRGAAYSADVALHALRGPGPYKYLRSGDGMDELYSLDSDPAERRNLLDEQPQLRERFLQQLDSLLEERRGREPMAPFEIDAEEERALEALGYL